MTNTDDTHLNFQNDQINVVLVKKPRCLVQADIKVSPEATRAAYEQAIKIVNKEASMPGFRKGKAPREMIVKQFGHIVDKEWRDITLNTSFNELLEQSKVYPYSKSSVKHASVKSISNEEGAVLSISYECAPHIPSIDPTTLTIKQAAVKEITDKEIDETIENYRLAYAEWENVSDRPAVEKDYIYIDVETLDEPKKQLYADKKTLLSTSSLDPWLYQLLIGMNIGESREGVSEPNPEEKNDAFIPTRVKVALKKIETPILPEVNEEFAKRFGKETVEDFKEGVTKALNRQAEDEQKQESRRLVEEAVLSQYHFDVPDSLVKEDLTARKEALTEELKEHGLKGEMLKTYINNLQPNLEKRVESDLRMLFITQEVARQRQLTVDNEEIQEEFMQQLYQSGTGNSIIHRGMEPTEVRSKLYISILMRKVLDVLHENANLVS